MRRYEAKTPLAFYMSRENWTDREFARLLGVDRSTLSKIRLGTGRPSLRLAIAIERMTGGNVSAASLFYPTTTKEAA